MRVAVLFSGGKDSTYVLHLAYLSGHDICCLISLIPLKDSWLFHKPFLSQIKKYSQVLGLPILTRKTHGEKDKELNDLKELLKIAKKRYNIEGIYTGALSSEYQRMRFNFICEDLNLKVFNPLWHKDQLEIIKEESKIMKIMVVSTSAYNLSNICSKIINNELIKQIEKLKYLNNKAFEGGEAETLVLNAPLFKKELLIKNIKIIKINNNESYITGKLMVKE